MINLVRGGLGLAFLPASVAAGQGAGLAVIEVSDHAFSWCISVAVPGLPPADPPRPARS